MTEFQQSTSIFSGPGGSQNKSNNSFLDSVKIDKEDASEDCFSKSPQNEFLQSSSFDQQDLQQKRQMDNLDDVLNIPLYQNRNTAYSSQQEQQQFGLPSRTAHNFQQSSRGNIGESILGGITQSNQQTHQMTLQDAQQPQRQQWAPYVPRTDFRVNISAYNNTSTIDNRGHQITSSLSPSPSSVSQLHTTSKAIPISSKLLHQTQPQQSGSYHGSPPSDALSSLSISPPIGSMKGLPPAYSSTSASQGGNGYHQQLHPQYGDRVGIQTSSNTSVFATSAQQQTHYSPRNNNILSSNSLLSDYPLASGSSANTVSQQSLSSSNTVSLYHQQQQQNQQKFGSASLGGNGPFLSFINTGGTAPNVDDLLVHQHNQQYSPRQFAAQNQQQHDGSFHGGRYIGAPNGSTASSMLLGGNRPQPMGNTVNSSAMMMLNAGPVAQGMMYQVQFKRSCRNFTLINPNNAPSAQSPNAASMMMSNGGMLPVSMIQNKSAASNQPLVVSIGDFVVVEADRGEDIGIVTDTFTVQTFIERRMQQQHMMSSANQGSSHHQRTPVLDKEDQTVGCILRIATLSERQQLPDKFHCEQDIIQSCNELAMHTFGLPIVVIDAEYQFDRHKLTLYYDCASRIDFRELVRHLYSTYKARIWMKKISSGGVSNNGSTVGRPLTAQQQQQHQFAMMALATGVQFSSISVGSANY